MKNIKPILTIFIIVILNKNLFCQEQKGAAIYNKDVKVQIVNLSDSHSLYMQASYMLAQDIHKVCQYTPGVFNDIDDAKGEVILIGNVNDVIKHTSSNEIRIIHDSIAGTWERFAIVVIKDFNKKIKNAICILGSDYRGTAYGVFSISEQIGVSPWYWWADATPQQKEDIYIDATTYISPSPSVKYRGIFLNDEDWGLQPWAANTFEPEIGDIGPKTYAKIFELLLRLKANTIWPAMHPSTRAFFHYSGNPEMAKRYGIVIGSSHAEPMLRNNVDEWNKNTMGNFEYNSNKNQIYNYWETRVKESKDIEAIYTVGMRGIHDSKMEGYNSMESKAIALEEIINDQRGMLQNYINEDVTTVPQAFTPYKEVLDIYNYGMILPDDITIIWPDDNYGYIRRLNDSEEQKRTGGSGVYYHASYWGRPHDYLWLSSTNPWLIWHEMSKAYEANCKETWIVNVGDIKPCEFNMSLFLDMAYNMKHFKKDEDVYTYLTKWYEKKFPGLGNTLSGATREYYHLAFQRKPEFNGWNQVEHITLVSQSDLNHFTYNDEVQRRMKSYEGLILQVDELKQQISANQQDAFFELVEYPVKCAAWVNLKYLSLERAYVYANQQRLSANEYALQAEIFHDSIVNLTDFYNENLASGKWKHMMSMEPRGLPVFKMPIVPQWNFQQKSAVGICLEGHSNEAYQEGSRQWRLPDFYLSNNDSAFMDVYLKGSQENTWELEVSHDWINVSNSKGTLKPVGFDSEKRIWVSVNGEKILSGNHEGMIQIKTPEKTYQVRIYVYDLAIGDTEVKHIEMNQLVSIWAENYSQKSNIGWQVIDGMGYTGKVLAWDENLMNTWNKVKKDVWAEYEFYSSSDEKCELSLYCLPVHPVNTNYSLQVAVSIDGGNEQVVDFRTFGRSEQWKQNVLSNTYKQKMDFGMLKKGKHVISVRPLDPGIVLDRIEIDFGGLKPGYLAVTETVFKK